MPRFQRKDAFWLGALVVLVALFFHKFILFGLIPINADWLHANFQPGRSYLDARAHNAELDDPIYQIYPLRMEAVRQWKEGVVPLWNPKILCGTPLLADGIAKPFDPLIALYLLFGGPVGRGLELFLHFLLMASGTYLAARALGLSPTGAAVTAIVFTFDLLSVTWMEMRTASGTFAFLPWAFLFLNSGLDRGGFVRFAGAALTVGVMILSGHPQFTFYAVAVLAAFVLWRCFGRWRETGFRGASAALLPAALALAAGMAVAAVEVLPFLELSANSGRSLTQYARANRSATPLSFLTYFYPNFFGSPLAGDYAGARVLRRTYMTATAGFVGAGTVAFILTGLVTGRFKHKRFFCVLVFAVPGLMLCAGAGIFELLPPLGRFISSMDISRLAFLSNFAGAFLAGAGIASLAGEAAVSSRRRLAWLLLGFGAAVVIVTASLGVLTWPLSFFEEVQASEMLRHLQIVGRHCSNPLFMSAVLLPLGFFAAAVCIALFASGRPPSAHFAAALVAFELLLAGFAYNPFVKSELVAPEFAFLKAIPRKGEPERVLGVDTPQGGELVAIKGDFLVPNTASLYGLEDVRGDESLRPARYLAYVRRIVPRGASLLASVHIPVFDSPLLDALNARFVMSAVPLDGEHLKIIYADGRAWVYQNSRAVPRAHLVGRWWRAGSLTSALNIMSARADFTPRRVAVVEAEADSLPEESGELSAAGARVLDYGPSRVVIETESDRKALLVLADTFYPGWQARIDDEPARILIANGTLRGVFIEAGTHRVVFSYGPAVFTAGAALSLASLTCCLLVLLTGLFRRSRRGRSTDSL